MMPSLRDKGPSGRMPLIVSGLVLMLSAAPAYAFSELQQDDLQPPPQPDTETIEREPLPDLTVPFPDPIRQPPDPDDEDDAEDFPEEFTQPFPLVDPDNPPEILYDIALLPEPVRLTRERLMEIARAGDLEGLRPLMGEGDEGTQISLMSVPEDPIAYLRDLSGDAEGHEILAILYEVLEAGFVHINGSEPEEAYVWPYFFALPLEGLQPGQRVELFRLVTAGDYEDMKAYGGYIFYRTGIAPDGRWVFFVAGH